MAPQGMGTPVANDLMGPHGPQAHSLDFPGTFGLQFRFICLNYFPSLTPKRMNHFLLSYPARHLKPGLPFLGKCPNRTPGDEKSNGWKTIFHYHLQASRKRFFGRSLWARYPSQLVAPGEWLIVNTDMLQWLLCH